MTNKEYAYLAAQTLSSKKATDIVMIDIAERLSAGLCQLRVDLYEIGGKVYFGEMTFYSQSGFDTTITHEADIILGSKLTLPDPNH